MALAVGGSVALLNPAAWSLLCRYRLYDGVASSARRQRWICLTNGRVDECQYPRGPQGLDGGKPDKSILLSVAKQEVLRIWQGGTTVKGQADPIGGCGDGNDAARRASCGAVTDDEEVIVVINDFDGRGQELSNLSSALTNQLSHRWFELCDESIQLLGGGLVCGWSLGA
jgi:hypothetical protein